MKTIGQYKIKDCTKVENGIKLILEDLEGNEISGTYNLGNLSFEQMQKMVGQQISCSNKDNNIHVHKAWDGNTPTFCDSDEHANDDLVL